MCAWFQPRLRYESLVCDATYVTMSQSILATTYLVLGQVYLSHATKVVVVVVFFMSLQVIFDNVE